MNNNEEIHPLIVIHNIINLTTKDVERYCLKYDKNVSCFRRRNRQNHQYIHALFSSMTSATNFLNNRPHFIKTYRINTSLQTDPLCGPQFVCVQMDRYAPISEDDLFRYTNKNFGRVLNCVLYKHRGYAFIEFECVIDANRAIASKCQKINASPIEYCPRHDTTKIAPTPSLMRLVHIGNFASQDQDKLRAYFPNLQNFSLHQNCYGQIYILGSFDINESIELLLKRAYCFNGRVLNVFIDNDDILTECNNFLLVRRVPYRLSDYNLLEYFSKFGRVLNCYRYGQTDAYRVQYRDKTSLERVLQVNRIHVIKSVQIQIENEQN